MHREEVVRLVSKLKEIAKQSLQFSLTFDGQPVVTQSVFTDAVISWLAVTCELLPDSVSPSWVYQTFYRLHTCDVKVLGSWLKNVALSIRNCRENTTLVVECFKGTDLGGKLTSGMLLTPVYAYADFSQVSNRRLLLSYFDFMSRVTLRLPCEDQLIADYKANEQRLRALTFSDPVVTGLNVIMREWFSPYPLDIQPPKHGPGAVSGLHGRPSRVEKYANYGTDALLRYGFAQDERFSWCDGIDDCLLNRQSELLFVPKSLTSYRTICKEPVALQFWQQSVLKSLIKAMAKPLKNQVNLSDQTLSQDFAKLASKRRDYVTIDLSNASDSVATTLVKRLFRGTGLLKPLLTTRSRTVKLPDGSILDIEKFAPMGSACCFPVECIVFAGICELGTRLANRKKRDYRVYGDDIICHQTVAPYVLSLLQSCGFLVNNQKSFTSPLIPFRESCGGEYVDGIEVTPLRLSRWFSGLSRKAISSVPDRYVDFCNDLFAFQMRGLRQVIISNLLALKHPPCFSYGSLGLHSFSPTNFHLPRSWKAKDGRETCEPSVLCGLGHSKEEFWNREYEIIRYLDYAITLTRDQDLRQELPEASALGHRIGKARMKWKLTSVPLWFLTT